MKWSYSSLDTYLNCSLAYYYRYIVQAPEEQVSSALPFGSALHAAHERIYRDMKETGSFDPEVAVAAFAEDWGMLAENPILSFKKGESVDSLLEKGVAMLKVFFEAVKPEKVVDVDIEFKIPIALNDHEDALLTGFMDLVVENGMAIVAIGAGPFILVSS